MICLPLQKGCMPHLPIFTKSTNPSSKNTSSKKSTNTPRKMNNSGTTKIMEFPLKFKLIKGTHRSKHTRLCKPPPVSPSPICLNRIDHSSEDDGEQDVSVEVAPLSYGPKDYGGASGCKCTLTEKMIERNETKTWKKKKAYLSEGR